MSLTPGQVIVFEAQERLLLAIILSVIGRKKLVVLAEDGKERRISQRALVHLLAGERTDPKIKSRMLTALEALHQQRLAARAALELPHVWQQASQSGEATFSLDRLAALAGGADNAAMPMALLEALAGDPIYFKQKREGWLAREAKHVEQLREQHEAQRHREAAAERFAVAITELMGLPAAQRQPALDRHISAHPQAQAALGLLKDWAARGDGFEQEEEARALLEAIEEQGELELQGAGSRRAFELLVALGVWSRFENIWLHRYHVPTTFPGALLDAAQLLATAGWEPLTARQDLRDVLCFSVDDPWTHDLDDAISCVPDEQGGWTLGVHIADPDAMIACASPLDLEARRRGTSIYLPTGTIPMLPQVLGEDVLSLKQGAVRPALSTLIKVNRDLQVVDVQIVPSLIQSTRRLSYEQVDQMLAAPTSSRLETALRDLAFITSELYYQRLNQGAVDFNIPQAKVRVTLSERDEPQVDIQVMDVQTPARALVAEVMILASAQMARFCYRNRIPVVYRSQDPPDEELLDAEVMAYPEGLPRTIAMLRRMKSGYITTHPEPHFALGVPMYVQATSPLRRYTDLICQRQVKAFLAQRPLPHDREDILTLATLADETSREASRIERETQRYWTLHHLAGLKGKHLSALVTDSRSDGTAFLFLEDVALRARAQLRARPRPGDRIEVIVDRADPHQDILRLKEA